MNSLHKKDTFDLFTQNLQISTKKNNIELKQKQNFCAQFYSPHRPRIQLHGERFFLYKALASS